MPCRSWKNAPMCTERLYMMGNHYGWASTKAEGNKAVVSKLVALNSYETRDNLSYDECQVRLTWSNTLTKKGYSMCRNMNFPSPLIFCRVPRNCGYIRRDDHMWRLHSYFHRVQYIPVVHRVHQKHVVLENRFLLLRRANKEKVIGNTYLAIVCMTNICWIINKTPNK